MRPRTLPRAILLGLGAALFGLAPGAADAQITGTIRYAGAPPKAQAVDMSADPTCRAHAKDDRGGLRVSKGRVEDVFVYLAHPKAEPGPPRGTVRLRTKGCQLVPRIAGVRVGQKLEIENEDGTLYSVRVRGGGSSTVRRLPKKGSHLTVRFSRPQIMARVSCDVHPWVTAFLGVLDHPHFAVTNGAGKFSLPTDGLTDGTYEIRVWHEVLGEQTGEVTVKDGAGTFDAHLGPVQGS